MGDPVHYNICRLSRLVLTHVFSQRDMCLQSTALRADPIVFGNDETTNQPTRSDNGHRTSSELHTPVDTLLGGRKVVNESEKRTKVGSQ